MIQNDERTIIDQAWSLDYVKPLPPQRLTDQTVAVVGSGPSGLACAQQLTRAGHTVVVYERDDAIGGLMRYGIPNFKLDKRSSTAESSRWKPKAPCSAPAWKSARTSPGMTCVPATTQWWLPSAPPCRVT